MNDNVKASLRDYLEILRTERDIGRPFTMPYDLKEPERPYEGLMVVLSDEQASVLPNISALLGVDGVSPYIADLICAAIFATKEAFDLIEFEFNIISKLSLLGKDIPGTPKRYKRQIKFFAFDSLLVFGDSTISAPGTLCGMPLRYIRDNCGPLRAEVLDNSIVNKFFDKHGENILFSGSKSSGILNLKAFNQLNFYDHTPYLELVKEKDFINRLSLAIS